MNKKILGAIIIGIIIIGGGIVIATSGGAAAPTIDIAETPIINETPNVSQNTPATNTMSVQKSYTLAEIAQHSNKTSCWTTVNGNVYDLTPFIGKHPGGEAKILSICGKDGTAAFTDQHGGQRRPENELAGLEIGVLK